MLNLFQLIQSTIVSFATSKNQGKDIPQKKLEKDLTYFENALLIYFTTKKYGIAYAFLDQKRGVMQKRVSTKMKKLNEVNISQ